MHKKSAHVKHQKSSNMDPAARPCSLFSPVLLHILFSFPATTTNMPALSFHFLAHNQLCSVCGSFPSTMQTLSLCWCETSLYYQFNVFENGGLVFSREDKGQSSDFSSSSSSNSPVEIPETNGLEKQDLSERYDLPKSLYQNLKLTL